MKNNGVQNIIDSEAALPRMQPSKATTKRTAHSSISIVMHRNNLKPLVLQKFLQFQGLAYLALLATLRRIHSQNFLPSHGQSSSVAQVFSDSLRCQASEKQMRWMLDGKAGTARLSGT